MQLFSADTTMLLKKNYIFFAPENMKKPPSKVAHNRPRPFFFQYCQSAQIQPKSQFLFHKNLPPRDFSIMTLEPGGSSNRSRYLRVMSCSFFDKYIIKIWTLKIWCDFWFGIILASNIKNYVPEFRCQFFQKNSWAVCCTSHWHLRHELT